MAARARPNVPAIVLAACAGALALGVQGWFLLRAPAPISTDEGYMGAFALALAHGRWLPYVDAVSQRGPVLYWFIGLCQWVFGLHGWVGLRVATWLCAALALGALCLGGWAVRSPLGGAIAGVLHAWVHCMYLHPDAGIAMQGEVLAGPLVSLGYAALAVGVLRCRPGPRRMLAYFASGLCCALAAASKQTAALLVAPAFAWLLVALAAERGAWRSWLAAIAAFLGGWALVPALIVARYAAAGELDTLWYWTVTYNLVTYMDPYADTKGPRAIWTWFTDGADKVVWIAAACSAAGSLALALRRVRSLSFRSVVVALRSQGLLLCSGLGALVAVASVAQTRRFWPHYWMLPLPLVALASGLSLAPAFDGGTRAGRQLARWVFVALFGGLTLGAAVDRVWLRERERGRGHWARLTRDPICEAVELHSAPGDSLFVWGFEPDLHVECQRRPASRYVFSVYVAGVVPPFWTRPEPAWVARDARRLAVQDLEQSAPPVILDIVGSFGGFGIRKVPELAALLARDYQSKGKKKGRGREAEVFVRRRR